MPQPIVGPQPPPQVPPARPVVPPPPPSYTNIPNPIGGAPVVQIANRNFAARALDTVTNYAEEIMQAEQSLWLMDFTVEKIGALIFFSGVWSVLYSIGLVLPAWVPSLCDGTGGYLPTWLQQLLSTWGLFTLYGDPRTCNQVVSSFLTNWFGATAAITGGLFALYVVLDLIVMKWLGDAIHPGGKKR